MHVLLHYTNRARTYCPLFIDDETRILGLERYHKLIVDSTFIAILQPEDSAQRKAY